MNRFITGLFVIMIGFGALSSLGAAPLFEDGFHERLKPGWSWIREDPEGWKIEDESLQIRVQPGNMWGPANNARNVLTREVPRHEETPVSVTTRVENHPTEQYEQIDLVWYYDDSHMVKIGQELVDGQLSIVMGREEGDRTRTLAIIPIEWNRVDVRLTVDGDQIQGYYRLDETNDWEQAGECELPVHGEPKISLQAYQGPADAAHWARIFWLRVERTDDDAAGAAETDSDAEASGYGRHKAR